MLKKRNKRSRNRYKLRRGYVHKLNLLPLNHHKLTISPGGDERHFEGSVFFKRGVCLSDNVILFHKRVHINYFLRNTPVLHFPVGRPDKPGFIYPSVSTQAGYKSYIGTFRSFYRAYPPIVGRVNIPDLKPCPFSGKTTGTQCAQPSFVGYFRERVGLVHKLGELARGEELF